MWHKNHKHCSDCGKTDAKHMAKGLCVRCYLKRYREAAENRDRIASMKKSWYRLHHPYNLRYRKRQRETANFGSEETRRAVLDRDGHQCARCPRRRGLVVHHIDRTGRRKPVHNNAIDNLITLCRACHLAEHRAEYLAVIRARYNTPVLNKHGRWSQKYDRCEQCKQNTSAYAAGGLCSRCYQKLKKPHKSKMT